MKKIVFVLVVMMAYMQTYAQCPISVNNISVRQNGQTELVLEYQFMAESEYTGYSFSITLPEGFSLVQNERGKYEYQLGSCHENTHGLTISYKTEKKSFAFGCISIESDPLLGNNGVLMTLPVKVDETVAVGEYQATIQEINFAKLDGTTDFYTEEVPFSITVKGTTVDVSACKNEIVSTGCYDLLGCKVKLPVRKKGLYIKDGKKMLVQ